ncbi:MAG: iron-only hydrogenase system regulator [Peptostreptococcaceae bacterium]|nr:iron-only hydrogenase system regulator [Peptostreptococcaceae bacterium]
MQNRIGVIGIVIENLDAVQSVNYILHEHSDIIVGRMGIPYKQKKVSVISLIVDGQVNDINSMTGKLGKLKNVSVKAALTKN